MKIAVVGAGISGLSAAYYLSKTHKVDLFEKENKFGGHANTIKVAYKQNKEIPIDIGFMVFNKYTYPNLINFFSENKIEEFYLEFFMRGILQESKKYKSVIASGHTYQSIEPGIAITMNGSINSLAKKNQAIKGDLIYLSKQLGSGYLLSAYFRNSPLLSIKDFLLLTPKIT